MTIESTPAATLDFEQVLCSRQGIRLPGSLALGINGQLKGVHQDRVIKSADTSVDAGAMSITAVISTPDEDRSEDVVEPLGCKLARYSLNPINYYNHGEEYTLPIGKSKDESGNLCVSMSEVGVTATSFFRSRSHSRGRSSRCGTRKFCGQRRSTSSRSFAKSDRVRGQRIVPDYTLSSGNYWSGGRSEFPTTPTQLPRRSTGASSMAPQLTK